MKSLKLSLLSKSIAGVIAGSSLAATAAFAITATPNLLGTPDDGMICRSGYTGAFTSAFKCSKVTTIKVDLVCAKANFPTYVIRPQGSAGTPQGRDICTRNGVIVSSTDSVVNLVQGQDYVLAAIDETRITERVGNLDTNEASALGLDARDVDTVAAPATLDLNGGVGSKDKASVQVTQYTFAIKTGNAFAARR